MIDHETAIRHSLNAHCFREQGTPNYLSTDMSGIWGISKKKGEEKSEVNHGGTSN